MRWVRFRMENNRLDDADENNPLIPNDGEVAGEQEWEFRTICLYLLETHFYLFLFFLCIFAMLQLFDASNQANYDADTLLYFTDIHIDHEYVYRKSSNTHCHNIEQGDHVKDFKFGQYGCDTTVELLDSFYEYLQTSLKTPKLIIFGGDLSCTWTENRTLETVRDNWRSFTTRIKEIFPNVPFIFSLGNGEFVPNYGSLETDQENYENIYDVVKYLLNEEQAATFRKGGYYYYDLNHTDLRFVLLNTAIYSQRRENSTILDPYDQFTWLREVLNTTKKVAVVFHIQTGVSFKVFDNMWYPQYIEQLSEIFKERNPDYLLGAHNHIDILMPLFNTENLNLMALSHPAISPQHDNNPAFRVYTFSSKSINDYIQYHFDIKSNPLIAEWVKEYRFSDSYKTRNLTHDTLSYVAKRQQSSSKERWEFFKHVRTGNFPDNSFYICIAYAKTKEQFNDCLEQFP